MRFKLKYNSPVSEFVTRRVFLVFKGISQVFVISITMPPNISLPM